MNEDFLQRSGKGFDGTPLRHWVRRRGPHWLLTCTGYGGALPAWRPLFQELDADWSILIWDYRGQFGSEAPPGDLPIQIADHSRDLEILLSLEDISKGVLMGWSVGVQVALEHYRRRPDQVEALVLIHGAYERVLHGPLGAGLGSKLARGFTHLAAALGGPAQPVLGPLFRSRGLARLASALGVVRGNVEAFAPALAAWEGLDLRRYFEMALTADEHVTSDMHGTVEVPTLITAGHRDRLSPTKLAQELHEGIPGSQLLVVPDTTHYAIIEKPAFVARSIDRFLVDALGS